jgi:hypothetical protein
MKNKFKMPFDNLTKANWINLAIAATITSHVVLFVSYVRDIGAHTNLGFDYIAFWSSGKVANESGFPEMYNLERITEIQKKFYTEINLNAEWAIPIEAPYLPIFLIPFSFLALISLPTSFFVWTLSNLFIFVFYLCFFIKKMTGHKISTRVLLLAFISVPVLINFLEGQLNIWLAICIGEFIRAMNMNKPFKAGFWLGGWLLKPQLFLLILPFLIIQRKFRTISGFISSAMVIFLGSFSLIGWRGFKNLFNIWIQSGSGGATSNPNAMINWRMIGSYLSEFLNPFLGYGVTIIGSLATLFLILWCFRYIIKSDSSLFLFSILGVIAATCVATWHAHLHMAIILIPILVLLFEDNLINKNLFFLWIFIPLIVERSYKSLLLLRSFGFSHNFIVQTGFFLRGSSLLLLNLLLVFWAIKKFAVITQDKTLNESGEI